MILLAVALVVGLVLAQWRAGTLVGLGRLAFRRTPLVFAALGVQVLIFSGPASLRALLDPLFGWLYVGSFALLLIALAANRALPGLKAVFAGVCLNTLVIAVNGGRMPSVLPGAGTSAVEAGPLAAAATNTAALTAGTYLTVLADVLSLPSLVPGYAISAGDLLIAGGIIYLLQRAASARATPAAAASPGIG
ncbi:MAG TPA: DUF5317 family protein [Chloroflexota bacterium]|jgi:hypothetical protein